MSVSSTSINERWQPLIGPSLTELAKACAKPGSKNICSCISCGWDSDYMLEVKGVVSILPQPVDGGSLLVALDEVLGKRAPISELGLESVDPRHM
jgi:hypothetical protein